MRVGKHLLAAPNNSHHAVGNEMPRKHRSMKVTLRSLLWSCVRSGGCPANVLLFRTWLSRLYWRTTIALYSRRLHTMLLELCSGSKQISLMTDASSPHVGDSLMPLSLFLYFSLCWRRLPSKQLPKRKLMREQTSTSTFLAMSKNCFS